MKTLTEQFKELRAELYREAKAVWDADIDVYGANEIYVDRDFMLYIEDKEYSLELYEGTAYDFYAAVRYGDCVSYARLKNCFQTMSSSKIIKYCKDYKAGLDKAKAEELEQERKSEEEKEKEKMYELMAKYGIKEAE